jgi:hypothetical protein
MLTAEGQAVAKIVVLRSNSQSVRLVNHGLKRTVLKPATILVPLSGLDSSSLHLRLILVASEVSLSSIPFSGRLRSGKVTHSCDNWALGRISRQAPSEMKKESQMLKLQL